MANPSLLTQILIARAARPFGATLGFPVPGTFLSIGIIDTLYLVEVARAAGVLKNVDVRPWFREYLTWMTTHQNGKDEQDAKNNHGTCWTMQVAEFARYTNDAALMALCRERFKTLHVPGQIAADGSFPLGLRKPS